MQGGSFPVSSIMFLLIVLGSEVIFNASGMLLSNGFHPSSKRLMRSTAGAKVGLNSLMK